MFIGLPLVRVIPYPLRSSINSPGTAGAGRVWIWIVGGLYGTSDGAIFYRERLAATVW